MTEANRERMRYLLRQLSIERLEREDAPELRQLLLEESARAHIEPRYRKTLLRLVEIIDLYIAGKFNFVT